MIKRSIAILSVALMAFASESHAIWQGEGASECPEGYMCMMSSNPTTATQGTPETLSIWPHSESASKLRVIHQSTGKWETLTGAIAGFTFQPGHAYVLDVTKATNGSYSLKRIVKNKNVSPALAGTSWKLETYDSKDLSKNAGTLAFKGKNLSAKLCNGMSGSYNTKGGKLTTKNVISTRMYCEGGIMDAENAIQKDGLTYDVVGGKLTIRTQDGHTIVWSKAKK